MLMSTLFEQKSREFLDFFEPCGKLFGQHFRYIVVKNVIKL